jgi:c-di-GMP-binding flagellar brake protein YcgR
MDYVNRRSHFRVEILVPVTWRVLNEKEVETVKEGNGNTLFKQRELPNPIDEFLEQVPPGSKEEQMFRSIQMLNNKLDFIIEHLVSGSVDSMPCRDDLMEISASGLKFKTKESVDVGEFLKMNLIMPGTIQYRIGLIAEVLRVEAKSEGSMVAAHIIHINDDARDSIIKTVFQKQRMDIRRLKAKSEQEEY